MFLKQVAANTQLVPRDSDKTMIEDTFGNAKKMLVETVSAQRRALNGLLDNFECELN